MLCGEREDWMGKRQVLPKTLEVEENKVTLASGGGDGPCWDSWADRDAVRWSWLCRSPDAMEDRTMWEVGMG